ncbi:SH3 domain-containing protein [Jiella pacifica]|uniref:SH3 domain-containing protein n=1 Tax=Jiella pacifica TaxID=2696469 RepID=A0A6N9SYY9_9HYPH|nr:SH3 domain-containing protein [Jiella pacifica]NDW02986.1 SH3 domain-containing protein [Jiella pacifica]
MKKTLLAAAALASAVALPAGSAHASEKAIATTNVNLRAGPSTDYPVVDVLVAGEGLRVFGCLQTRSWCDVRFRGQRGWISANYIALTGGNYSGRHDFDPYSAPVITFSVDNYWGDHYRSRNFYRDRDRFRGHRGPDWDRGDRRDRDHRGPDRHRGDRGPDRDWGDRDGRGPHRGPDYGDRGRDRDRGDRRPDFRDRDRDRGPDRADFDRPGRGPDRGDFDRRGRGDHGDRNRGGRDHDRGGRGGNDGKPPVPLYRVD